MGRLSRQPGHPKLGMDSSVHLPSFWRTHRWLAWVAGGLLLGLASLAVVVSILAHRAEPYARRRVIEVLSERFHARVELDTLHLSLGNSLRGEWGVWGAGHGLRIWPPAEVEGVSVPGPPAQPLIELADFLFHAPLHYHSGEPIHIGLVRLRGLEIRLPPRSHMARVSLGKGPSTKDQTTTAPADIRLQIDAVDCDGAHLELQTDKPGKLPLEFAIRHFKVIDLLSGQPMHFEAQLTNPKPPGEIQSTGSFGPWNVSDPGESPLNGVYQFDHADLSVFKGIAGILSSTGRYKGTLRNIIADGATDTPDFRLSQFGNPMDLRTTFHARVDGTNGDTWLEPVEGTIGQSHFRAEGQIVRVLAPGGGEKPQSIGHDIALKVTVNGARLEDFLHLASRTANPIVTGDVSVDAFLHIPPGPVPVHEKMAITGRFLLDNAEFTSAGVQNGIRELSLRGLGKTHELKAYEPNQVRSQMQGDFQLGGGRLKLPSFTYTVPGANIDLHGTYFIKDDTLDFTGVARLQATVSQAVGGWKGMLLKPADPFFKKDGAGTQIPIYIAGTRDKPHFGLDTHHLKTTHPQRPGTTE